MFPNLIYEFFILIPQIIFSLRRIRCLSDAESTSIASGNNNNRMLQECVIQWEPKKAIRSRIGLIVQTFLRNVDCVRDVHTTLMTLVLRATLEVLAVEVWCPELRSTVQRELELHKSSDPFVCYASKCLPPFTTYIIVRTCIGIRAQGVLRLPRLPILTRRFCRNSFDTPPNEIL